MARGGKKFSMLTRCSSENQNDSIWTRVKSSKWIGFFNEKLRLQWLLDKWFSRLICGQTRSAWLLPLTRNQQPALMNLILMEHFNLSLFAGSTVMQSQTNIELISSSSPIFNFCPEPSCSGSSEKVFFGSQKHATKVNKPLPVEQQNPSHDSFFLWN